VIDNVIKALEQQPCDYYDTYNKTCRKSEVWKYEDTDSLRKVMKMKIECGCEEKELRELEAGDIFFFGGEIYIKTDRPHDGSNICVNLETGSSEIFMDLEFVGIFKDAVLKIGGYYK
jgi:hypothetical protein